MANMAKGIILPIFAVLAIRCVLETASFRTKHKSLHPELSDAYEETFAMTVDYERMKSNVFSTKSDVLVVTKPNGTVKVPYSANEEGTIVVVLAEGITLTNVGGGPSTIIWAFAPFCFERTYANAGTATVKGPFSDRAKEINGDIGPKIYRGISTQVAPSMKCNTLYPHLPLRQRVEQCTMNQQRPGSGLHEWVTVTETTENLKASSRKAGELCPFVKSADTSDEARPASYLLDKLSHKFEEDSERFIRDMLESGADVYHTAKVYRPEAVYPSLAEKGQVLFIHSAPPASAASIPSMALSNACTNTLCVIINPATKMQPATATPVGPVRIVLAPQEKRRQVLMFDFAEGSGRLQVVPAEAAASV